MSLVPQVYAVRTGPRPVGRATVLTPAFPALHGPRMVSVGPALVAADIIVAAGIVVVALASKLASKRRTRAEPLLPAPLALESEAAARRLKARFAGALDGGSEGVGSIGEGGGRDDGGDRRAEWRAFARRSRLHLVDADAWVPKPES